MATQDRCGICGQLVDKRLPYMRGNRIERRFGVVDHITPVAEGGAPYDPANLQLAHWECNNRKGARGKPRRGENRNSRDW